MEWRGPTTRAGALALIILALACGRDGAGGEPAAEESVDETAPPAVPVPADAEPAAWLFAWAGDLDRADSDFLAVIDARRDSPDYGRVTATAPVGRGGTMPHHTEHRMPEGGVLFANGFLAGLTFRFDLSEPTAPRHLGSLGEAAGWTHPHSYERLPNGNVLATFQGRGERNLDPGGLVEIDEAGEVVRSASAADPDRPGAILRPYSLAIVPDLDRVVTTSYDMGEDVGFTGGRRGRTRHVQVWRLSDLALVATIDLPKGPRGYEDEQPGEPRLLPDRETVLVATFACGLYRMTDLGGEDPGAEWIHSFDGGGCAVPVVVGRFWVQPVPTARALVALDVSDPARPREVSRLALGARNFPHWLALDPGGKRIVIADRGDGERRLFVATIDPKTGSLALDESFRDPGSDRAGVSFDRAEWPHGRTGAAKPHGVVFGGAAEP